jgi:prepilin-type N-terminal cleavage/methylation domain-containing protein/prepilin-type processing-associated H-X9-DG protein
LKANKTPTRPSSRFTRRAFSLVELLVVIAVIGILASLLVPALGFVKNKARRAVCLNNLRQINLGIGMYCDDFNGNTPVDKDAAFKTKNIYEYGLNSFFGYRRLIGSYVGMEGKPSPRDKLFACPADTFCYDATSSLAITYVPSSAHDAMNTCYSSYAFNGGISNIFSKYTNKIGLAGQKFESIREPAKTILAAEVCALFPYSWHQPGNASAFGAVTFNNGALLFDDARAMMSFVDGHVSFTKIFWNPSPVQPGVWALSVQYNPPAGYDYKWSGD